MSRTPQASIRAWTVALLLLVPSLAFANAITDENANPGTAPAVWDVSGAGDLSIQGFATDISVNTGGTVHFKVKTDAATWHADIYRLGYYQGNGARLVGSATVTGSGAQPADLYQSATGLTDCGNWSENANWVATGAVSGIYIARLVRDDTQGASHVIFIVRDDASQSDLLFKTSDATWQAYNVYGGNSLYTGSVPGFPSGHAPKVSYNRPFLTRAGGGGGGADEDWVFNSEYPMVRWLEANGYDVTYTTDVDADRAGALIQNHQVFLSVGHDEYWSAGERAAVEAARDAGVHLAFFSGNEVYWKTRWEQSIDGSGTPHRTLVCYKEGTLGENVCGGKCDPLSDTWTGLWRDGCAFPAADGCRPENALSGQISWSGTTGTIRVGDAYKNLRFWRNTAVAALGAGQFVDMTPATLGYEWDWEQFPASYPAGRVRLSTTTLGGNTHHLSLYRASSGALVFGAGTVQWAWGLDGEHDRGNDPPSLAMQQATVNLFADMGVQPASLQTGGGLVAATAANDATAPVSVITSPAPAASVPANNTVTITGTASDAAGSVVGVDVSVDGGTTWLPATGTAAWTFDWTPTDTGTVTIRSRAYDDLGNLEGATAANTVTVTVTPGAANCPCTLWSPSTVPGVVADADAQAVEVGMKFKSSVDGWVTGVRYYKSATNTGTHTGRLWLGNAALATATFTGETSTGWQEVTFPSPVAITAGTVYIISYHTSSGHYSQDNNYFTTARTSGPLRALADGESGPNGVYRYGAGGTVPGDTYQSSNYWVDVVFATSVGPDTTAPGVLSHVPTSGASAVSVSAPVTVTFTEAMDAGTVTGATLELRDGANALVAATVAYDVPSRTATLTPSAALAYTTLYTVTVKGGATDPTVRDLAGNAMAANVTWSFTTSAPPPPPPTEGPGGPILVISAAANPFSRYFVEILRNEGLNSFTAMDISQVTTAVLDSHDVVILGEVPLTGAQVTMLTDWTTAGGTLIASRPDSQFAGLLGITPAAGTLVDKYLLVNTASAAGAGIVGQSMQFHGTADLYTLNGATAVATLYSNATTATANPAVTHRNVGSNGGEAYAFLYDLARSVVYTRQGNPAWAGQKRDGEIQPIRSDDQFYPDWVDFNKIAIPQADEQQRLLANAIILGNLGRKPLPRFWYLPRGLKAAIVETGDDHGDGGMQPRFDIYRNASTTNCSPLDWECVRATGYLYVGTTFTDAQALFYHNLGFEVALHVNTNCANPTAAQYQSFITSQMQQFQTRFPSIPLPKTNRNHCIAWGDWSTVAEVEAANGIRFDTNYYYWPAAWVQNRPGMFTGSGMPMRFAKLDGTIIDCYQGATQMTDESGNGYPGFCDALLDKALGAEGYYGVFTTNMHFDTPNHAGSNAIVASAQARGVPVVSAQQMLDWLDGRNGSSFGNLTWSGNTLDFTLAAAAGSRNLRAMLPMNAAVGQLTTLTRNAVPVSFTTETIKGIAYAFFPGDAGDYVATYAVDETGPVVTNVAVTPNADQTASVTWTTNEPSDSRVDYGTAPGSLGASAGSATLVTSHSVTLTGLAASTLYYFRVTSVDGATNSTTEPAPPASPLSFTTPAPECALDATTANFALGTPGANTAVVTEVDGEVILKPTAVIAEFDGAALPGDWTSANWNAGGSVVVAGGGMTVDGAHASTSASFGPGRSLEYVATYRSASFQNVGFAANANFDGPWVTIGMGNATVNGVYARTSANTEVLLSTATLGTPHRYRIDWKNDGFDFWIDGVQVGTLPFTIGTNSVVMTSDFNTGGGTLTVDWLRLTPYAASGSFVSRVFDTGGASQWDVATWTTQTPAGTSVAMQVRTGNSPVPDGTWTAFTNVPSSGSVVGGTSRYLQYQANLASSSPGTTPVLQDVHFACAATPDTLPPVIASVTATPAAFGLGATITWATDELANSRVDYGTAPGALTLNATDGAMTTSHAVTLAGLTPNTLYYYRVTSSDGANSATEPASPAAPLSFTTTGPACAADALAADFAAGTPDGGTYVAATGNGEVILAPAAGAEFSGVALPAGWVTNVYGGSPAVVSGGQVSVDGAYAATSAFFAPGRSVEFVATFDAAAAGQHAGFSGNDLNGAPWAIFSTQGGGGLVARSNDGGETNQAIPGVTLGVPHRFRIDWSPTQIVYSVDGAVVATHGVAIGANMRPIVSDGPTGGNPLTCDWIRMTPYAASGSFTSRVFDAGTLSSWTTAVWSSTVPANTSLALFARHGNTATPDGSWSAYAAIPSSGSNLGFSARYLQYRADLASTDPVVTPELLDVAIACTSTPDNTPPVITSIVASPDAASATITWSTDEAADSRVDYGTSAGSLTSYVANATPMTSHSLQITGLSPGTTYHFRVTSADPSANSATSPVPPATLTFTTPAAPCPTDVTAADFNLGTVDANTFVALDGDGAVSLKASQLSQEFSGATLPAGWASGNWNAGGTVTVSGGQVTVDGAKAYTTAGFGPGMSLEFVATFRSSPFQNVALAADTTFNGPWLTIGQGSSTTNGVYIRTSDNAEVLLSTATLGTAHRYRIDWTGTSFVFWIDGVQVGTKTFTLNASSTILLSDFNTGGNALSVDWLRVSPYAASGTFVSRVFDGLGPTTWGAMTWTASTPSGTGLTVSARTGNTPVPDGTWSAYDPLTNGAAVGANSRYVQYKADLTSTAPSYASPTLHDLAIACVAGPDITPPVISSVVVTPATNGQSATITWTTDERATSRVDYGTTTALGLTTTDPTSVRSHSRNLTGLMPGVTYYYRVRSTDASGNEAFSPNPPAAPASFTTPLVPCFADNTDGDFGGGTLSGTAVSLVGDGEVILAPTLGAEFSGAALPVGWTNVTWNAGGASTVSGGKVSVDGSKLHSPTGGYSAGRVLEFVATFGAATFENAGFAAGDNTTGSTGMFATGAQGWAVFGTASSTTTLFARLNTGSSSVDVSLGTAYIGTSHRYRIEWKSAPDSVIFMIDGASVNRRPFALTGTSGTTMRFGVSDFATGGPALQVDWVRVTPYTANGTFASRVYDAGTVSSWGAMTWNASVPSGTSLTMQVRKGNTPVPDGSWTAYAAVPSSGSAVGGTGRYIQYLATLTANAAADQTPSLTDVGVTCGACNAGAPAVIANLASSATGNAGGGRTHVKLTWSGVTPGDSVAVYRKAYGDYPLYRSDHGSIPVAPATPAAALSAGWALTPVTTSPSLDAPASRDQWFYVAFVTNTCGTASGPSNVTAGTLDYLLGDVADGVAVCTSGSAGDAVVNTADLSALGNVYGQAFASGDPKQCLDVGPTVDFGLRSRPQPDQLLDFEDLVLYALNFETPLPAATATIAPRARAIGAADRNEVSLTVPSSVRAGERFDVVMSFVGTGSVRALSARLDWSAGAAEFLGTTAGSMLTAAGGVALVPEPGTVDVAVLGTQAAGLTGTGELAVVSFRAKRDGDPGITVASISARDGANRPVALGKPVGGGTPVVYATQLGPVFPNPFRGALSVSFSLARSVRTSVVVYDLAGRAVRRIEDGVRSSGFHVITWDGRTDAGNRAPAGVYVLRFQAGEIRQTRRVQLIP